MVLVGVDSGFIDSLIWTIVAFVCVLIIVVVERFIHEYRTTKESKSIDKGSHSKTPLAVAVGLDAYGDIVTIDQVTPEGLVQAQHGKGKNKTTVEYQLPDGKPLGARINLVKVQDGKDQKKTNEVIQLLYESVSKHPFLRGAKVPILGMVWDKGIAAGLPGLGALSYISKMEKLQELEVKIVALKELDKGQDFKELIEWINSVRSGWSVIDFNAVRTYFPLAWDQTRRQSQNQWHEQLGERKSKKSQDSFKTLCLYLGVLLIGVAALIAVLALFFK